MVISRKNWIIITFIFLLIIPLGFASFDLRAENVKKAYVGGSEVEGSIDLLIENELYDNLLTSNFEGGIKLIDLLKVNNLNQYKDYNCTTQNCMPAYSRDGASIENFGLEDEKVVGFEIDGSNIEINSIDFYVESDIGSSCGEQIKIEPFGNNDSTLYNTEYNSRLYECSLKDSGCFSYSLNSDKYKTVTIGVNSYCNQIVLNPAPSYKFGIVTEVKDNSSKLNMNLFNSELDKLGECELNIDGIGRVESECIINQSIINREKYFVCVSNEESNDNYEMRFENEGNVCGGASVGKTNTGDYEIIAVPVRYSSLDNLSVSKAFSEIYNEDLSAEADSYIARVYDRDCSDSCVIPFLFSGDSQNIKLKNISMKYSFEGTQITEKKMYSLSELKPKIRSELPVKLDLSNAHFKIPIDSQEKELKLELGGKTIERIPIEIEKGFSFNLVPNVVSLGVDTLFFLTSSDNITSSKWDFGDGIKKDSLDYTSRHRYTKLDDYIVKVTAMNNKKVSITKEFNISIDAVDSSARRLLDEAKESIDKFKLEVNKLSSDSLKNNINSLENISEISKKIEILESKYSKAQNDSEYVAIIDELISLNIPKGLSKTSSGTLPFSVGFSSIDLSYMEKISEYDVPVDKTDEVELNLIDWNRKNFKTETYFEVYSVLTSENKLEPIITSYRIKLNPEKTLDSGNYLIIDYPLENLYTSGEFKEISTDSVSGSAVLIDGKSEIVFNIKGNVFPNDLGMYLSPDLQNFVIEYPMFNPAKLPLGLAIFWGFLIVVGFFSTYIILQEWYKKHYEKYLFGNPDDLYNIITFIHNSRNSGISDGESRKKLKEMDWHGEQINFVYKKLDGQRTGMFEIPILFKFERKKIEREIAKRSENRLDARFIKRY
ncbi:hypothetical protein COU54_01915 [Candidatus Pacearchaeota archaeon CG10_big_fil_rev_8_21_14_0_10_31_24]|nr:MAG: hypothetical protein COU54_01915 [Candidatus Pacearchaeota archaeon CG10_big_fil_rev_8_21_14_0_10_31_24]